jgi:tetratricopeptide (TPR) repeat protein
MNVLIDIAGAGALLYAAVTVPRNARKARALRAEAKAKAPVNIDPAKYGLVPAAQLDSRFAGPDPEADAVAQAALAGDWRRAAAYLAGAGRDWDLRWYRLGILTHAAAEDDAWLKAWRTEYPGDPAAALVHADALVVLAGKVRGAKLAKHTTAEQFEGFHRLLAEALPACQEAARMAPDDPCPWIAQLTIARGLSWSNDDFRALWAEVGARDPHHFGAHMSALQYWCAKWSGSHELMYAFAEQAAASAPQGSLLSVLRLEALMEHASREPKAPVYNQPFVQAAVDATLDAVDRAPAGHHRLPTVRHLLADTLFQTKRYAEAVEQFRAVGGYVGSPPWSYSANPVKEFVFARTNTFVAWEKAGCPAPPPRGRALGY